MLGIPSFFSWLIPPSRNAVLKILEETGNETVASIEKACDEARTPYTINIQLFESWRDWFVSCISKLRSSRPSTTPPIPQRLVFPDSIQSALLKWTIPPNFNHGQAAINQDLTLLTTANTLSQDPVAPHGDNFAAEIMVMSTVLAYFSVSLARFVDNMSSTIGQEFLHRFCRELERKLAVELGMDGGKGDALCRRHATDRPRDTAARIRSLERIAFLEGTIARIDGICSVLAT